MIGYVLLAIGLILIFLTVFQSYNIFTDKTEAPVVFKAESFGQNNSADQGSLQQQIQQQVRGLLPADAIAKVLNLFSWTLLAFILMLAGGKVAGLGIKMLK